MLDACCVSSSTQRDASMSSARTAVLSPSTARRCFSMLWKEALTSWTQAEYDMIAMRWSAPPSFLGREPYAPSLSLCAPFLPPFLLPLLQEPVREAEQGLCAYSSSLPLRLY